jgi:hypothetical protein
MRIGIIGLPGAGKTTAFRVLTRGAAATTTQAGSYQVTTAMVAVPDPRVEVLSAMFKPKKTTHAQVEIADVAGLTVSEEVRRTEAVTGELTNVIGRYDAFVHVVRAFGNPMGPPDPEGDIAALDTELLLSDLSKVENRIERLEDSLKRGKALPSHETDRREMEVLSALQPHLESGSPVRDYALSDADEKLLRGFQLLTAKPVLLLVNLPDEGTAPEIAYPHRDSTLEHFRGRLEADLVDLDSDERSVFMEEFGLRELSGERLIRQAYGLLGRMTFFTVGEDEVRAWEVAEGAPALECAAAIHTDLAKGFIRAEVVGYDDLVELGSLTEAKSKGRMRLEGKEQNIHDGEILVVRFNV